jgi:hypothetical protein
MTRGLIFGLALFVAGCKAVTTHTVYEKPQELKEVRKGTEIWIDTVDKMTILMRYDSVTEDAITGYVVETFDFVTSEIDDDENIDRIPIENIEAIGLYGDKATYYKLDGEAAYGVAKGVGWFIGCLLTWGKGSGC